MWHSSCSIADRSPARLYTLSPAYAIRMKNRDRRHSSRIQPQSPPYLWKPLLWSSWPQGTNSNPVSKTRSMLSGCDPPRDPSRQWITSASSPAGTTALRPVVQAKLSSKRRASNRKNNSCAPSRGSTARRRPPTDHTPSISPSPKLLQADFSVTENHPISSKTTEPHHSRIAYRNLSATPESAQAARFRTTSTSFRIVLILGTRDA